MKICVFIFAFVAPVIIITVCYTLMVMRLKSVRLLSGSREKDRNLRRITRLVLVVVAVFVVCWTPIHIFILVKTLSTNVPETTAVMAAYFFCVALGYTNSSLNPILYAFLDENFKRCFRDFCCPRTQGQGDCHGVSRVRSTLRDHSCPAETRGGVKQARPVWLAMDMSSMPYQSWEDSNELGLTQITTAIWDKSQSQGQIFSSVSSTLVK